MSRYVHGIKLSLLKNIIAGSVGYCSYGVDHIFNEAKRSYPDFATKLDKISYHDRLELLRTLVHEDRIEYGAANKITFRKLLKDCIYPKSSEIYPKPICPKSRSGEATA